MLTRSVLGLASVALAVAAEPGQSRPFLRDKQGRFAVFGVTSQETEILDGGLIRVDVEGAPVSGFSRDQGLEFKSRRLAARIRQGPGGAMTLEAGVAEGAAEVTVTRDGGRSSVASGRIELTDGPDGAVAKLPAEFTFTNATEQPGSSRRLTVRAASGHFRLDPLSSRTTDPVRSARVAGPVTVTLVSSKTEPSGQSKSVMTARGREMTYDRATRTLVVSGNVEVDGEQTPATGTGFQGVMTVDRLEVTLSEEFEVVRVRTRSGSARLQEPRGG